MSNRKSSSRNVGDRGTRQAATEAEPLQKAADLVAEPMPRRRKTRKHVDDQAEKEQMQAKQNESLQ